MNSKNYNSQQIILHLKDYVKNSGKTKQLIEKEIGLGNGSLQKILDGNRIQNKTLSKIEKYLDNLDYNIASEPNAKPLKPLNKVITSISGNITYVPMVAYAGFSTGNNNPISNDDLEIWTLPFLRYIGYCFEVSGESMYRTLRPGERVFVEQTPVRDISEIQVSKVHVIETTTGDYLIKRVLRTDKPNEIRLWSDNPDYQGKDKDQILSYPEDFKRIWKVKDSLKWDLGFMEDMDGLDEDIETKAIKLDHSA